MGPAERRHPEPLQPIINMAGDIGLAAAALAWISADPELFERFKGDAQMPPRVAAQLRRADGTNIAVALSSLAAAALRAAGDGSVN